MDSGLAVPVFNQGDDPIAYLNKAMNFLTAVASLSYKRNATSSGGNNTRGQARVVKCYNCQGEGHMARQCTQPKRPRNAAWFKEKAMLAKAQEVSHPDKGINSGLQHKDKSLRHTLLHSYFLLLEGRVLFFFVLLIGFDPLVQWNPLLM
ncbi:retrovirus-related pol polyprotein from transposon TNT 1-94 [Tanacetum coccineum]